MWGWKCPQIGPTIHGSSNLDTTIRNLICNNRWYEDEMKSQDAKRAKGYGTKGMFTQKPLTALGSWKFLTSHEVRVSRPPSLSLHENSFGPQPITSSMDENPTWNPTWQVWIILVGIVRVFFGTILESRHAEILTYTKSLYLPKDCRILSMDFSMLLPVIGENFGHNRLRS